MGFVKEFGKFLLAWGVWVRNYEMDPDGVWGGIWWAEGWRLRKLRDFPAFRSSFSICCWLGLHTRWGFGWNLGLTLVMDLQTDSGPIPEEDLLLDTPWEPGELQVSPGAQIFHREVFGENSHSHLCSFEHLWQIQGISGHSRKCPGLQTPLVTTGHGIYCWGLID